MLALKKKREAEAKAKAEEAALAAANGAGGAVQTPGTAPSAAATTNESKKVSLLGVGGKKKQTGAGGPKQKKRSPGEIRIQKGEREGLCMLIVFYWEAGVECVWAVDVLSGGGDATL